MSDVIVIDSLRKTFRTPLRRRRVEAVKSISFTVRRGEIFGFLGPNGAGKTTTIRMLTGLIRPTSGSAKLLGEPVPSRAARAKIGFLPEHPYFYDYLTVGEMIDLSARIFGVSRAERKKRAGELIELVGLSHAQSQPMKKFSKGMLQRAGIAQALVGDPDLVIFDEPMSGLDPIGRKEVRDIILSLRDRGKTVFFSSHILADVETVSDRVAIITKGEVRDLGTLTELVSDTERGAEIRLRIPVVDDDIDQTAIDAAIETLSQGIESVRRVDRDLLLVCGPEVDQDKLLAQAREQRFRIHSVMPRHETLEDLFIRRAKGELGAAK